MLGTAVLVLVQFSPSKAADDPRGVLARARAIRRQMARAFIEDCGASAKMVTNHGGEEVHEWCAALQPFGNPVYASDLILLFQSRADSNRTGRQGPMSGDVVGVICFGGSLLAQARVREAIPVMAELLSDPVKINREWIAFCLFAMGEKDPELRQEIAEIPFPREAIGDQKPPKWAHVVAR